MSSSGPIGPPNSKRWMMFVDGENLTMRAQQIALRGGKGIKSSGSYLKDVFIWPDGLPVYALASNRSYFDLFTTPIRAYYYTSCVGDDQKLSTIAESLWNMQFSPQVFKKDSQSKKSKGVDIALTKDMLSHAFMNNYDAAALIAGDADYLPLVEEVKRLGKVVMLYFLDGADSGLSPKLKLGCDAFSSMNHEFEKRSFGTA